VKDHALEQHVRRLRRRLGPEAQNALWAAVQYALLRTQYDPDLRRYAGLGTQTFAMLCEAEAAVTGEPVDAVRERRSEPKAGGKSEVDELRDQIASLDVDDHGSLCGECDDRLLLGELGETLRGFEPFCSRCRQPDMTADIGETCMHCRAGVMLAPEGVVVSGRTAIGAKV
jgi:hypothetical protein